MKTPSRQIGKNKEEQARRWLARNGIRVIAKNFPCRGGELDLIGWDGRTLICFEVRYRRNAARGSAAESVTPRKLQRIVRCFRYFLQRNPRYADAMLRIDALLFEGADETPRWLKNITGF